MKRKFAAIFLILLFLFLLCGCDAAKAPEETTSPTTTVHLHQWQDITDTHEMVCTACNERQVKNEACHFVRKSCTDPMECTVCHAISDAPPEEHDFQYVDDSGSMCWCAHMNYACTKCDEEYTMAGLLAYPIHVFSETTKNGSTTFFCSRCEATYSFPTELAEFSYTDVLEEHKIGDPGVTHEGFSSFYRNFEIEGAIDAVVNAEFYCTEKYNAIAVARDPETGIWCVTFTTENGDGAKRSIYLESNGMPCYIIDIEQSSSDSNQQ